MSGIRIPANLQPWIDARKRFHLSHVQVQMARELGLNPKKLGKLANHRQEPRKQPLPQYIGHLYFKRFGRKMPENLTSIEEPLKQKAAKKLARREAKRERRIQAAAEREQSDS